jgi:hypothetical protein
MLLSSAVVEKLNIRNTKTLYTCKKQGEEDSYPTKAQDYAEENLLKAGDCKTLMRASSLNEA